MSKPRPQKKVGPDASRDTARMDGWTDEQVALLHQINSTRTSEISQDYWEGYNDGYRNGSEAAEVGWKAIFEILNVQSRSGRGKRGAAKRGEMYAAVQEKFRADYRALKKQNPSLSKRLFADVQAREETWFTLTQRGPKPVAWSTMIRWLNGVE